MVTLRVAPAAFAGGGFPVTTVPSAAAGSVAAAAPVTSTDRRERSLRNRSAMDPPSGHRWMSRPRFARTVQPAVIPFEGRGSELRMPAVAAPLVKGLRGTLGVLGETYVLIDQK
ncbi:hypothetical protein GCM10009557_46180 [Virgisporangium ochraceum]|uniref:Uncharacterized protein n=1 Tax=Virgisporangium ochraceum TaxID=65505 RepID=A0A8J3ZSL1_9ACTN|nr:hypothetical protein Voc01_016720 [Virgisporangium ochraceum]